MPVRFLVNCNWAASGQLRGPHEFVAAALHDTVTWQAWFSSPVGSLMRIY